ncbi:hypothetical protein [Thiohalophilus thiocyanatoxydans]|uniref:Lipoprotein n=1 Tax=Thiohalophilus thiocyanatoxydans TaxID=381308 RepID=A0A4R8IHL6_9GAMM|nr:hypothetical protein [Thiohalophilus thiocyanatoxydans]TDY00106.1 hypothetical protein EDC23_2277 [Thiohalophilus thiocyanatoxydans]
MRLKLLTPLLLVLGLWGCGSAPVEENERQENANTQTETQQNDSTEVNEELSDLEDDC